MPAPLLTPAGLDQLLTAAEASTLFNVTPALIRKWASVGKLEARGLDSANRKLYRLREVAQCEKQTRVRSGRARRERAMGMTHR